MAPKAVKNFVTYDYNAIMDSATTLNGLFGDVGPFEGMMERVFRVPGELAEHLQSGPDAPVNTYTEEGTRLIKEEARHIQGLIEGYQPPSLDTTPRTKSVRDEIINLCKQDLEKIGNGISVEQNRELRGVGNYVVNSYIPQMNKDIFLPENAAAAEKAAAKSSTRCSALPHHTSILHSLSQTLSPRRRLAADST